MNKKHITYILIPVLLAVIYILSVRIISEQLFFTIIGWVIFVLGSAAFIKGKYSKGFIVAIIGLILVYQFSRVLSNYN